MNISISRDALLRRGAMGTAAMVAIVLLCVFHSVVAGAVDRAAQRRATPVGDATAPALLPERRATRGTAATKNNVSAHSSHAFGARNVAYVRSVN